MHTNNPTRLLDLAEERERQREIEVVKRPPRTKQSLQNGGKVGDPSFPVCLLGRHVQLSCKTHDISPDACPLSFGPLIRPFSLPPCTQGEERVPGTHNTFARLFAFYFCSYHILLLLLYHSLSLCFTSLQFLSFFLHPRFQISTDILSRKSSFIQLPVCLLFYSKIKHHSLFLYQF